MSRSVVCSWGGGGLPPITPVHCDVYIFMVFLEEVYIEIAVFTKHLI